MKKLLMYVNSMNKFGGIERVIANLSDKLCEYYDLTILVKDEPVSSYQLNDKVKLESINVKLVLDMNLRTRRIWSVFINFMKSQKALREYFHTHRFDFIYTAFPLNGLEVYLSDRIYRSRIVASEHASYHAYNRVYREIKKWLYPRLKVISVPTTMDTEIYKNQGYNVAYIPHLSTYDVTYKKDLNSKVIINVGRLTADKQQNMLLDIWKSVNDMVGKNEWKLQIIGSGEEEENLKQKIDKLCLKNVEMIPHTDRIKEYYQNAGLFVFTSKMEGFGMVLLEAAAFGVPCISFDCPSGPRDIIKDGKNGFLVKCYDKEKYAKCIIQYMGMNYDERKRMSVSASNAVKNWNNEYIVCQWIELFSNL